MKRGWWSWIAGWGYPDWLAGTERPRWIDAI